MPFSSGVILATSALFAVLFGPIFVKPIERNVELFFMVVGILTAEMAGQFGPALIWSALREPLSFTLAVLTFGAAFRLLRGHLDQLLARIIQVLDPRGICFGLTIILGSLAGFITPVVAALVFVEAISLLRFDRRSEIAATVFACFAIGFGAGITPLGMPGIAVVLDALHADFWYLGRLLGPFVAVGIALAAIPTLFLPFRAGEPLHPTAERDSWRLVLLIRPGKVYVFIVGLVALSDGLRPVINTYLPRLPNWSLFWLNTVSALLNNSTLAAVEVGPALSLNQQRAALLGMLISGGMLIPGNIPNIIAASRLGITSREWARIGLATGMALLILCFVALSLSATPG